MAGLAPRHSVYISFLRSVLLRLEEVSFLNASAHRRGTKHWLASVVDVQRSMGVVQFISILCVCISPRVLRSRACTPIAPDKTPRSCNSDKANTKTRPNPPSRSCVYFHSLVSRTKQPTNVPLQIQHILFSVVATITQTHSAIPEQETLVYVKQENC